MDVVVTGATSFIGTPLVRELQKKGCRVWAVVRPGSPRLGRLEAEAGGLGLLRILPLELSCIDMLKKEIPDGCGAFFHLGWDGSGSAGRKNASVQRANAGYAMRALETARELGCRRFIFSGSQAEYGIHMEAMAETTPCLPVSEYGRAKDRFRKMAGEALKRWRAEGCGLEYIHARIFSVYGPGDHQWSLVESCLEAFSRGERMELGECAQMWNYLYIDDLVRALLRLSELELLPGDDGIYNIAGAKSETRPLKEYVELMRRLCGFRGEACYGRRPQNAEGSANLIPDIRKLSEAAGWKPEISFEEGISRMLRTGNYGRKSYGGEV